MPDDNQEEVKDAIPYSHAIPAMAIQPQMPVTLWKYMFPVDGLVSNMTLFLEGVKAEAPDLRVEVYADGQFIRQVPVKDGENTWSENDPLPVERLNRVELRILSANGGARFEGAYVMFDFLKA